jgi:putative SOS response-associated peptidase YedK
MSNLYSLNKGQDHLRQFFKVTRDETGNMPPLPGIFPDTTAPVIRQRSGERVMQMMRWGLPTPPMLLRGTIDPGVTNVRNVLSAHWRRWLRPEFRCLVPVTSFSEYTNEADPVTKKKTVTWFALSKERPLFAFAGIWCTWIGTRGTKKNPVEGMHTLYAFFTTEPNRVVKPIHSTAMPVILRTPDEFEAWLSAPLEDALKLQRPLPDDALRIVARGERQDG